MNKKQNFTKLLINCCVFAAIISALQLNSLYSQEEKSIEENNNNYSIAIEDNSFLIEEAYNQEKGVVQHIFTGMQGFTPVKDWKFSFTQEWPLWGQTNQFSYTLLYNSFNSGEIAGLGDLMLNYRYQMTGKEDFAAMSPRLSVILPIGDKDKGLGNGVPGVQFNFPACKRISESFAVHFNAGVTVFPGFKAKNIENEEVSSTLFYYNTGASIIWFASYNLNIMCEVVIGNNNTICNNGKPDYFTEAIINPGFRYAININELQIVPGVALLITFAQEKIRYGRFLYLSFEHPF